MNRWIDFFASVISQNEKLRLKSMKNTHSFPHICYKISSFFYFLFSWSQITLSKTQYYKTATIDTKDCSTVLHLVGFTWFHDPLKRKKALKTA